MAPRRKKRLLLLVALVALLAAGAWTGDLLLKKRNHPGLVRFVKQWASNYPASFAVEPPVVRITIDEGEMDRLQEVVDRALERGVIEQEGNEPVDARIDAGQGDFKARVRIKGKMTDHVEGRKWSFRVIAKKEGGFLGMKRFSLQHPGTRNYLCDWLFHQLARGEGIVALRYGFCRVELNGEDLGIYAYEEHFGPELLEHNERLNGPLLRFDPGLFWQHRLNGLEGASVADAYGAYQAAALDAYGTSDLAKDPADARTFEEALALVDAFRRGQRPASEVFDADRTARRLALLDLIGGHHSMDWSDVKFHYNPGTQRLEPVSYESFSASRIKELAGAYRYFGRFKESDELHTQLFNDPVIAAAYVHHLERMAVPAYLDSAFNALKGPLDTASATLYREFPYKELDRSIYHANQKAIARLLAAPRPVHAYLQGVRNDTLVLRVVPTDMLPVQVDSLVLKDGRALRPLRPVIIPSRPRGGVGMAVDVRFAAPGVTDSLARTDATLACRLLGSAQGRRVPVQPFGLRTVEGLAMPAHKAATHTTFPFVEVDEAARRIRIRPGAWTIDRDLVVPPGYTFEAYAPLKLALVNGAELVSRSPVKWIGTDEQPVIFTSPDSSSMGVHVIAAGGMSTLDNVHFTGLMRYAYDQQRPGDVSFHSSPVSIAHGRFSGTGATLLDIALSDVQLRACTFTGGSDQLELHFCRAQVSGTRFEAAGDDAVSLEGGGLSLATSVIVGARGIGVKAAVHASTELTGCEVRGTGTGLETREGATIRMAQGLLEGTTATHAGKDEMRYGPTRIELKEVAVMPDAVHKAGQGSTITLDGKALGQGKAAKGT